MTKNTHRNQSKPFLEIKVGDAAQFEMSVNEKMHQTFSKLFGDFSPIHSKDDFCAQTKFKKRIGYGFLLTGFLSKLYGEYLPGGNSICLKQEANFIQPFFIGDTIKVSAEVTQKIESIQCVEILAKMYRNSTCIFRGVGLVQII